VEQQIDDLMQYRRFLLIISFCLLRAGLSAQADIVFSSIDTRNGLSDNRIRNIAQLTDGRMLITTEGVVNIYNGTSFRQLHLRKTGSVSALPGYYGMLHSYVAGNYVWMKNTRQLTVIDLNRESYIQKPDSIIAQMGIPGKTADLFLDEQKNYWIKTTDDQLFIFQPATHSLRLFRSRISYPEGTKDELYDIAMVRNEVFLFYSNGLMLCYDMSTAKLRYKTNSLVQPDREVYNRTLMVVQAGDILYMLRNNKKGIMQAYNTRTREWNTVLKTDYWLNTISVDKQGIIWVSCKAGLWRLNSTRSEKQLIRTFRLVDGTDVTTEVSTLYNDPQGGFWIGTYNHGLLYYHPDRFKFRNIGRLFFNDGGEDIRIQSFSEPTSGMVLIETNKGMYSYHCKSGEIRKELRLSNPQVQNQAISRLLPLLRKHHINDVRKMIYVSPDKVIGICNSTLFEYDLIHNKLRLLLNGGQNRYTDVICDSRGYVWVGTQDGLLFRDPKSGHERILYKENGLVNNNIKSILQDKNNNIWVTTAGGISRIKVTEKDKNLQFQIAGFNRYDGVIENEFLERSIFLSEDGLLFAGGINGMNIVDLHKPWQLQQLSKPLFTSFTLAGTELRHGMEYGGHIILNNAITATDTVNLAYNQNFIGLSFSALNYVNPTQTYYQYRMIGVDDYWREIHAETGTGQATYTNLTPGTYVFEVKAANNSKQWTSAVAQMTIVIKPPFWKSTLAYFLYILLLMATGYLLFRYYQQRTHRLLIQKNEEKLNQMKFQFFTNISHEFRTPLTLILTPLESVMKELQGSPVEKRVHAVYRHAQELLNLVNELLDFRRLEINGEKLNLSFGNISSVIALYHETFEKLAIERKINFSVISPGQDVFMYFDSPKLFKVLNNLLSNAFKFTPDGGNIKLTCKSEPEKVVIEIADNGSGIPEADIPYIFDRFYQGTDHSLGGSGIGLYLAQEYIKLHKGSIHVQSIPNQQTIFTISLPTNLIPETVHQKNGLDNTSTARTEITNNEQYKIVLVEDNEELRHYLASELVRHYTVMEATDGVEGLELIQKELPDLIVSDVMMPRMDGMELCRKIKSDLKTSHIPVILLTARASEVHRISGLQIGADEYLTKPFNMEVLLLRISRLIADQHLRQKHFSEKMEVNPRDITISSLDEQLIQKALDCVEKNMDNAGYSVQQLSHDLNMDRTVLYKKLQSITGLAPLEFIRSIRLKRAAQLLAQGNLPVAEVSEMVGFNTQKYFTKYFKETFGVTPSQYNQQKDRK